MTDTPTTSTPATLQELPATYGALTKVRLSMLVVVTTGVGFIMASVGPLDWWTLFWTVVGTMACACSANGLNQVVEVRRDTLMDRTKNRPMPSGAISRQHGWIVAVILGYLGLCALVFFVNLAAAGLSLLTMLIYVLLYTPMKLRTTLNTLVGAVVGAIPPLIGWVATGSELSIGAWILAALLFVWQLPHFLALAWLYRDDYDRAGFKMLPGVTGGEHITCEVVLLTTMLLIPLGVTATMIGMTGTAYAIFAIIMGIGWSMLAFTFFRRRDRGSARRVFLASLLYLPLLLGVMIADRNELTPDRSSSLVLQPIDEEPPRRKAPTEPDLPSATPTDGS
ncbi:MAG: heme o synthase [Phycisphaerales bacterium]|nr:heme o synthase [Phycisphaerales bacterium]